ncbi:MAG: response regulator [Chitinophagaceae bacterium]|nr:MAG: response regulator [Chitinophagaceae bacterium]
MTTSKHTIVYAEDDLDDLFIVKQAFEKHDHIEVIHAPDGRKALHTLEEMLEKSFLPCLVILDINMPVMNGRETLQEIRKHPQLTGLSVVLFSTSNSSSDAEFARKHNAVLITKPIEYSDLENIAAAFVEKCNFEINKLSLNNKAS